MYGMEGYGWGKAKKTVQCVSDAALVRDDESLCISTDSVRSRRKDRMGVYSEWVM